MKTEQIIAKQKELIKHLEKFATFNVYGIEKRDKLKSELSNLESQESGRANVGVLESAMIIQQIWRSDNHNPDWEKRAETVGVLQEYAQSLPAKQDEQINNKK